MTDEFKITPSKNAVNLIPIGLEDIPIYASDVSVGLSIDGVPTPNTPPAATENPNIIPAGGGSIIKGFLKSQNYNEGASGWAINGDGSVDFESGNFRGDITGASGTFSGTITATAGSIGGWTISANAIYFDGATDALSAGMAPADYPFYAGKKYADRATAPFKVEPSGKLTVNNIVATGTINAQAGYLAAGVYIDTSDAILCESAGLNVGVAGHIRGGQTDYDTGIGFFLGYDTDAYKLSIGNPAGEYLIWDGSNFSTNKFMFTGIGAFGGDGSDGDKTVASDEELNPGSYQIYSYNDLTINVGQTLSFGSTFQNKVVKIKVKGNCIINGTLSVKGLGGSVGNEGGGGSGQHPGGVGSNGGDGGAGIDIQDANQHYGGGGEGGDQTTGGPGGSAGTILIKTLSGIFYITQKYNMYLVSTGSGGGGGGGGASGVGTNPGDGGKGAYGGLGGGALILEVLGNLTIGGSGAIEADGNDGSAGEKGDNAPGSGQGAGGGGGGGSGGAGGMALILYNGTLSNSGSITVTGGSGGAAGAGGDPHASETNGGAGGGSGGSGGSWVAGSTGNTGEGGSATSRAGGAGVTGGVGKYILEKNITFA